MAILNVSQGSETKRDSVSDRLKKELSQFKAEKTLK